MGVSCRCLVVLVLVCAGSGTAGVGGQIAFPEINVDPNIKNRDNRQPMYAPSMCPENELLYPGDQASDWICDCRPAYLFHPLSDRCHEAYRRGPCQPLEYLVLPAGSVVPRCVANPCRDDGLVPWGAAGCVRLHSTEVCPVLAGRPQLLAADAATLELICQPLELSPRVAEDELDRPPAPAPCGPGCRRTVNKASLTNTNNSP